MDRQKKRLSAALSSLSAEIASIGNGISVMEIRARRLVETALEESDPRLFNSFQDAAKGEIEKVLSVVDEIHELLAFSKAGRDKYAFLSPETVPKSFSPHLSSISTSEHSSLPALQEIQYQSESSVLTSTSAQSKQSVAPPSKQCVSVPESFKDVEMDVISNQLDDGLYASRSEENMEDHFFRPIGRSPPKFPPLDVSNKKAEWDPGEEESQIVKRYPAKKSPSIACPFASNHEFDESEIPTEGMALTPLADLPPLQPIDGSDEEKMEEGFSGGAGRGDTSHFNSTSSEIPITMTEKVCEGGMDVEPPQSPRCETDSTAAILNAVSKSEEDLTTKLTATTATTTTTTNDSTSLTTTSDIPSLEFSQRPNSSPSLDFDDTRTKLISLCSVGLTRNDIFEDERVNRKALAALLRHGKLQTVDYVPLQSVRIVTGSECESPAFVWVTLSPTSEDAKVDIYELIDEMTDFYDMLEESGDPNRRKLCSVSIGDYVAVKTNEEGRTSWLRGRVIGVDSKTRVGVLLIDVGGVQVVDVSHLQFLEPKFASAPCISLPCHLRQIGPSREPMECSTTDETQTEVTYSWHQFNKSLRDVVEKINSSENSSSIKWFSEFYQHHNFDEVFIQLFYGSDRNSAQGLELEVLLRHDISISSSPSASLISDDELAKLLTSCRSKICFHHPAIKVDAKSPYFRPRTAPLLPDPVIARPRVGFGSRVRRTMQVQQQILNLKNSTENPPTPSDSRESVANQSAHRRSEVRNISQTIISRSSEPRLATFSQATASDSISTTSSTTSSHRMKMMAPKRIPSDKDLDGKTEASVHKVFNPLPLYVSTLPLGSEDFEFVVDESLGFVFLFSNVVDPGLFHIHPIIGGGIKIDDLNNLMYRYYFYSNPEVLKVGFNPTVGDILVAHYALDGNFYRAIIRDIRQEAGTPTAYFVFYFDYGNTEWTTWENLGPLLNQFSSLPPQCIKCQMVDIMPKQGEPSWSIQDSQLFKESIEWDTWYHGYPTLSSINVNPRETNTLSLVGIKKLQGDDIALRTKLNDLGMGRIIQGKAKATIKASPFTTKTTEDSSNDTGMEDDRNGDVASCGRPIRGRPPSPDDALLEVHETTRKDQNNNDNNNNAVSSLYNALLNPSNSAESTVTKKSGRAFVEERCRGVRRNVNEFDMFGLRASQSYRQPLKASDFSPLKLDYGKWFVAEVISFKHPGLFYVVLPFGLNPVLSKDGSLSEVGVKAENNVGRDFEEAVASGETNGNRELQDALNEFYRKEPGDLSLAPAEIDLNSLVVTKYNETMFLRTKVVSADPSRSEFKVFYVDFGNTQTISAAKSHFFHVDIQFQVPFFAIPCGLANVEPVNGKRWTSEAKEWFMEKVNARRFMVHVRSLGKDGRPVVDMWDTHSKDSNRAEEVLLSEELIAHGFARRNFVGSKESPSVCSTLSCNPCR